MLTISYKNISTRFLESLSYYLNNHINKNFLYFASATSNFVILQSHIHSGRRRLVRTGWCVSSGPWQQCCVTPLPATIKLMNTFNAVLYDVLRNEYRRNVDPVIHNTVSLINCVCLIIIVWLVVYNWVYLFLWWYISWSIPFR